MTVTTTATTVHTAVMQATGPEGLASIVRPLTGTERAALDDFFTRTAAMTDAEYAQELRVPVAVAADIRDLLTGATR